MKTTLFYLLFISSLYGNSLDQNLSRNCSEIINEIDSLKKEKFNNTSSKISTIILGSGYVYGLSNEEIDIKIRLLKLELSSCKWI